MPRSKKNGVTPKSETKKQTKTKGGNPNSKNPSIGKPGSKSSSKRKKKSRKDSKVDADSVDDVDQDQLGSTGGTAGAASGKNRDAMREEVMTQVTVLDVGL